MLRFRCALGERKNMENMKNDCFYFCFWLFARHKLRRMFWGYVLEIGDWICSFKTWKQSNLHLQVFLLNTTFFTVDLTHNIQNHTKYDLFTLLGGTAVCRETINVLPRIEIIPPHFEDEEKKNWIQTQNRTALTIYIRIRYVIQNPEPGKPTQHSSEVTYFYHRRP